jgi:hypothetical protein
LGYQRTKDGKNFKEIMFLDSDGYVIEWFKWHGQILITITRKK